MSMTPYLENLLINASLRHQAFTPPPTYIGLFTALSGDGVTTTEVAAAEYVRQSGAFGPPTSGVALSSGVIQFPAAVSSWGTITHGGTFDASTGGNLLYWGTLDTNRTIASGETFQFPDRGYSVSLD